MGVQDRKNVNTGNTGTGLPVSITAYTTEMDYDGSGNVIYFGLAEPGSAVGAPAWQIRRLDYSGTGNCLDVLYANGSRAFNQVWTGRAGLSYS